MSSILHANNVRVGNLVWDKTSVNNQDVLTMTFNVSWENSWRDDYNYDAAYIFFKFRHKDAVNEAWHHLYLQDEGNCVAENYQEDYECWVSPLSVVGNNLNTGIYIFRKENGAGRNSVDVVVKWNIKQQLGVSINSSDIADNRILVSAFALEMVYIPQGPYRLGDGVSKQCFRKTWQPILEKYDVLNPSLQFRSSSTGDPKLAVNHANDNTPDESNAWVGDPGYSYWIVDFGEGSGKKITYFGVNAASHKPTYYPEDFELSGGNDPDGNTWEVLWKGSGEEVWSTNGSAYPIEKAIKVTHPGFWRCYRLRIQTMHEGYPIVKAIGMTDQELDTLWDRTVLVDGPTLLKDSVYYLGARDGETWTGYVPETFPNGYKGFYAMKYEISQEQYVRFLNKLSYQQQNGLLDGRLEQIEEGRYIFGDDKLVNYRNGVMLSMEVEGRSSVFSNNYKAEDEAGKEDDGQNIACNYMSIHDMLAYADWSGLRPLTEMEYEKMCRPLYPYMPKNGEYAWNTTRLSQAATLLDAGKSSERVTTGNANYATEGGVINGPLRCGAFTSSNSERESSGAGYWGGMELSGNLAEMYYNVNYQGLEVNKASGTGNVLSGHRTYHGDGNLTVDGHYSLQTDAWQADPKAIALRGGSFASTSEEELAVSDRTYHSGALASVNERLPYVSFRLGRSIPEQRQLESNLILENEEETGGRQNVIHTLEEVPSKYYQIEGQESENMADAICTYIWYMKEEGDKHWKVLSEEHNKDLMFRNFRKDSINVHKYYFRRKVSTPFTDSDSSSAYYAAITVEGIRWGEAEYTLPSTDYTAPFEIQVRSSVPSVFSWKYNDISLMPLQESEQISTYKPMRGHFDNHGEAGDYIITVQVNDKERKIRLKMEEAAPIYSSNQVPCGKMMKDVRDNEIYGTVQIGNQCWMTENLRFKHENAKPGYDNLALYGYYYTWYTANNNSWTSGSKQGICPAGWRLPTSTDWQTLLNTVGNDARNLKDAKYWQVYSDQAKGNNATGFSAVGTGKYYNDTPSLGYHLQQTRFWTSERTNTNDGVYIEFYYNTAGTSGIQRPVGYNWGNTEAGSVRCVK